MQRVGHFSLLFPGLPSYHLSFLTVGDYQLTRTFLVLGNALAISSQKSVQQVLHAGWPGWGLRHSKYNSGLPKCGTEVENQIEDRITAVLDGEGMFLWPEASIFHHSDQAPSMD